MKNHLMESMVQVNTTTGHLQQMTGVNLLKPGKEPENNKVFQLVLACLMSAVDKHAVLLRTAASNTGNDHRLGANEAPPAIISIYLGDQVGDVVDQIIKNGKSYFKPSFRCN